MKLWLLSRCTVYIYIYIYIHAAHVSIAWTPVLPCELSRKPKNKPRSPLVPLVLSRFSLGSLWLHRFSQSCPGPSCPRWKTSWETSQTTGRDFRSCNQQPRTQLVFPKIYDDVLMYHYCHIYIYEYKYVHYLSRGLGSLTQPASWQDLLLECSKNIASARKSCGCSEDIMGWLSQLLPWMWF